jgi:small subunit ribosomal protein S21
LIQVTVHAGNVDHALRSLKKRMQREGVFRCMKLKKHYEKPSLKKKRKAEESERRRRKLERKKNMMDEF